MQDTYEYLEAALLEAAAHYNISGITVRFEGHTPILDGADSQVEARLFGFALKILTQTRSNIGQSMLVALWHVYLNGFVTLMEEEYDPADFVQWVRDTLEQFEDDKYTASLSYVVARIFQDVHTRKMDGQPYHDDQGEITVERLLNTPGLIKKLVTASSVWEMATPEQREEILENAINAKSHTKVKEKVDQVRDGDAAIKLVIPYRVHTTREGTTVVFENLSADQFDRLQSLVRVIGEPIYAAHAYLPTEA